MKNRLLAASAVLALSVAALPVRAELDLNLGGHFAGYGVWSDNDISDRRSYDLRRDAEIHVSGEAALDNGLSVGFHTQQVLGDAGQIGTAGLLTDEAYVYVSSGWGRVTLGSEDGAAYLLQVAAPSADSNIDGLKLHVQALEPVTNQAQFYRSVGTGNGTYTNQALSIGHLSRQFPGGVVSQSTSGGNLVFGYGHFTSVINNFTASSGRYLTTVERVTYMTPKLGGFQAGLSYAPEQRQKSVGVSLLPPDEDGTHARYYDRSAGASNAAGITSYENIAEAALRWDGNFSGLGVSVGGAYGFSDIQAPADVTAQAAGNNGDIGITDGVQSWNGGVNLSWNGWSLGGSYLELRTEVTANVEDSGTAIALMSGDVVRTTSIVGLAWDGGPYHLGATYYHMATETPTFNNLTTAQANNDVFFTGVSNTMDRVTFGGGYAFGPGMSFRGSVSFGEFKADGFTGLNTAPVEAADNRFTQVAVGTQINF